MQLALPAVHLLRTLANTPRSSHQSAHHLVLFAVRSQID
ncbi:Uncharacterised protein [Vibrio cholerae]|nr:Uncharacterised protein [Vibrio cholerae]